MNTDWKRERAELLAHLKEHGVISDVEAAMSAWSDTEWAEFFKRPNHRRELKERIVNEVIKSIPLTISDIANVQVDRSGPQSAYIRVQPKPDGDVHCYSVKITEMKLDPMAGHPVPDLD